MDSSNLTDAQLTAMRDSLARHIRYISKLVDRMEQVNWNRQDHVYLAAKRARDVRLYARRVGR